jgi:hypothetical protein
VWPASYVLDSKAAPYGDGEMLSSKTANGLAALLSVFVVVAAVRSAAATVIDGKRGSYFHTESHTFLPTFAISGRPYSSGKTAARLAQQHTRSVYLSPGFAFIHLAHGPPESA